MSDEYWKQKLQLFLSESPRPWGWARWLVATARAEMVIDDVRANHRDLLMQLLAIAPRPSSYKRFYNLQQKLLKELRHVYCVSCIRSFPPEVMIHGASGVGRAAVAGLLCPDCNKRQQEAKSGYPKAYLPLVGCIEGDYERIRCNKPVKWYGKVFTWARCFGCGKVVDLDYDNCIIDEEFGPAHDRCYVGGE